MYRELKEIRVLWGTKAYKAFKDLVGHRGTRVRKGLKVSKETREIKAHRKPVLRARRATKV